MSTRAKQLKLLWSCAYFAMCGSRANLPTLGYFSLILFTMLFLRWHRAFREPEAPDSAAVINHDQLSTGAAGGSSWRQQLGDRRTTRNTLPPTVSIMVMYRPPPPQNSSTSSSSSGLAAMEGQKPGTLVIYRTVLCQFSRPNSDDF